MPLAFTTLNRGVVPFGFFNVKSDMILLAEYFAFADEVCGWIEELATLTGPAPVGCGRGARCQSRSVELRKPVWSITDRERLGDFHGAMAGTALWGFFGAVYRRFPFPSRPRTSTRSRTAGAPRTRCGFWPTSGRSRASWSSWPTPRRGLSTSAATASTPRGSRRWCSTCGRAARPVGWAVVRPDYVERMMRGRPIRRLVALRGRSPRRSEP